MSIFSSPKMPKVQQVQAPPQESDDKAQDAAAAERMKQNKRQGYAATILSGTGSNPGGLGTGAYSQSGGKTVLGG